MMRDPGARTHAPHPVVFMILILPFGVMSGYLTVAVVYLLTQAGVSIEQSAELVALSYVPHTWKFLWAPIADTTLTRKRYRPVIVSTTPSGNCSSKRMRPCSM